MKGHVDVIETLKLTILIRYPLLRLIRVPRENDFTLGIQLQITNNSSSFFTVDSWIGMNKNYAYMALAMYFSRILQNMDSNRKWLASSLLVFFMQCKLVYKSIICSIRFFDFNFQGAIGEWRFLDFYSVQFLQVRVCQVFICFVFLIFTFHKRPKRAAADLKIDTVKTFKMRRR